MSNGARPRHARSHVIRFGDREVVTEGLHLGFWTDISHHCMTASWPAFVAGAALVFLVFNAIFAGLYWLGDQPVSNVPGGAYVDYLYFSIETLSTAGYGDMHPQSHYGHFIATIELFTGIFSMSLMTGLIFARFSRPKARLLFAEHPVVSVHDGRPTLMIRFANARHNIIGNATARLWMVRTELTAESSSFRRFIELPLLRSESPALALSWTLFHIIDETSPLHQSTAEHLRNADASFIVLITGYDEVAAQTIHARWTYLGRDVRYGHRFADIVSSEGGRVRIDYSRFHDVVPE